MTDVLERHNLTSLFPFTVRIIYRAVPFEQIEFGSLSNYEQIFGVCIFTKPSIGLLYDLREILTQHIIGISPAFI